ncbi:MAG: FHA domain-containing protein [Deltaproteobacteria bacterium]|nr:FHA domain-containing protein [Deltaproteobacteria bacterium]
MSATRRSPRRSAASSRSARRTRSSAVSSQPADSFVIWTDDQGDLQRTEVPVDALTIGRWSGCGVVLPHKDVGAVHVAVERTHVGARLRSLSRVKQAKVGGAVVSERELENGDQIGLGDQRLTYVEAPPIARSMMRLTMSRAANEIQVDLPVAGSITVLGRMEGDILVDDDSVSSRHLEIENFGPGLTWVRDLGSTNGSELNGEPLRGKRVPLREGDIITIGRVMMAVSEAGEPPEGVTSVVQRTVIFLPETAMA